jgi:hypothetical protein
MAMKQTNLQHPNHTMRNIRRVKNTGGKAESEKEKESSTA